MQNLMFKIFPVAFTVFLASSMYSGNLPSTAYQPKRIWENVDYVGDSIVGHQMNKIPL